MSDERKGKAGKAVRKSMETGQEPESRSPEERVARRQRVFTLVISLAVACFLWLYVMEEVNPVVHRSFSGIRVHVKNEAVLTSKDLTVTTEDDQYVRIKATGKRGTLMDLEAADFVASADASSCTQGENYITVKVETEAPVEVEKITSSQIRLDVEPVVTEQKEVKVAYNGEAEDGRQPVTVEQEFDSVEVTGAQSAVSKVAEVRAEVRTEKLSEEAAEFNVKLMAVDRKGREVKGVQTGQKQMSIGAQIYIQKEVELRTSYTGLTAEDYRLVAFDVPETVRIALPVSEADRVYSVTSEAVDLSSIEKSTSVDLNLHHPGSAVLAEDQETPKATVKIAKITQQTMKFETDGIEVNNLPSGRQLSFDASSVEVTLTGTAGDLSALDKKNIRLSVNAAYVNRYTAELPLIVEIGNDSDPLDVKAEAVSVPVTVQ